MADKPSPTDALVTLGPLPGLNYAEMVSEALTRAGIPHILKKDSLSAAYNTSGGPLPGNLAYILVPTKFEQKARDILEQLIDHF